MLDQRQPQRPHRITSRQQQGRRRHTTGQPQRRLLEQHDHPDRHHRRPQGAQQRIAARRADRQGRPQQHGRSDPSRVHHAAALYTLAETRVSSFTTRMSDCCSNPPPEKDPDRQALRRSLLKLTPPPTVSSAVPSCCAPEKPAEDSCCGGKKGRPDFLLWGSLAAFLTGIAIHLFVPAAPAWLHVFGHACYELLSRAWWGLLIGIVAVAVIGRLPRELVAAVLGRGGSVSGLFRAVGAGVLLDLCNHGILMVGMQPVSQGSIAGSGDRIPCRQPVELTFAHVDSLRAHRMAVDAVFHRAVDGDRRGERTAGGSFGGAGHLPPNPHAMALGHLR
jgi:hypothetical protein